MKVMPLFERSLLNLLFTNPIVFVIIAGGLVLAITLHEAAHAFVADKLGDSTPRSQGRITLNPAAHLDPLGTIALLLVGFGWGKPVQFDPYNLKNPLRDTALIALAGPATNFLIAVILAVMAALIPGFLLVAGYLITINIVLAVFNLIPVHPLDGGKILLALLPPKTAIEYDQFMHRYGTLVLLFLIFPFAGRSPASQLISPIISAIVSVLIGN